MAVIGNLVCQVCYLRLQRWATIALQSSRCLRSRHLCHVIKCSVFPQTLAHFKCQVQTWKTRIRVFEELDYSHTLAVVIEAAMVAHAFSQHLFARMSERRVSQIVREGDRFGEIFIQP